MATFKKLLAVLFGGAIVGAVVASLLAPGLISRLTQPAALAPKGFDLSPFAKDVMGALLRAQLIGAGVGAALALLAGFLIVRGRSARRIQEEAKTAEPSV